MSRLLFITILCLLVSLTTMAQNRLEGGIKGGATFTHGYTTVPPVSTSAGVTVPQLDNKNNGIGIGYSAGIWGRRNFDRFFIQVEVGYNDYLLKQKTDLTVPASLAFAIVGQPLPSALPGQTPTAVNLISESTLQTVTVPVLIGKRWGNFRAFLGPSLLFTTRAQITRNTSASIGTLSLTLPVTTTDLKKLTGQNPNESILEVKDLSYAGEVGVGYTLLRRFDLDLRYAAPVGGVYKSDAIKGYFGIATASLGIRLF